MNNVDALKKLYTQLGGSAADVANVSQISDMIEAVSEQAATATAPELPEVTNNDFNKSLYVDGNPLAWTVGVPKAYANGMTLKWTTGDETGELQELTLYGFFNTYFNKTNVRPYVKVDVDNGDHSYYCWPVYAATPIVGSQVCVTLELVGVDFTAGTINKWSAFEAQANSKTLTLTQLTIPSGE